MLSKYPAAIKDTTETSIGKAVNPPYIYADSILFEDIYLPPIKYEVVIKSRICSGIVPKQNKCLI